MYDASLSTPLPPNMQVINANSNGIEIALSANLTWVSPTLPGEPPNVLRYEFAGCVPSNITLSSICCSAVKGHFVEQGLDNRTSVDDAEVRRIYESKYPNQNVSVPTSVVTGSLINATDAGDNGSMNWCNMAYNPLSDIDFTGTGYVSGGALLGKTPQSVLDWIKCFEDNTSEEARSQNEVAYVCAAVDVMTGGRIEGYNVSYATQSIRGGSAQNNGKRGEPSRWVGILGVALVAGLWTICV